MKVQINQVFYQQTNKYKDITLVFRFFIPLTKTNASLVATMLYILEDRNQAYPTKASMIKQMDYLYGATLTTSVVGYGQTLCVQIASKVVDPRFVNQKDLLQQHVEWFKTIITQPLFTNETITEAKTEMIAALKRVDEQPSKYAANQAHLAFANEAAFGVLTGGDKETIDLITMEQLQTFHQELIKNADWIGFVIGKFDLDQMVFWMSLLPFKKQNSTISSYYMLTSDARDQINENKKISQSTLIQVLKTNSTLNDEYYYPNRIASIALGQLPTSYLFTEIREKRSLAYSIYSQYIAFDGVIFISTGINPTQVTLVDELIKEQVKRLEAIDDVLLTQAKNMLINAIKTSEDDIAGWINLETMHYLINEPLDIEAIIKKIEAIDKHQIAIATNKWQPVLTYHLQGENNESH